MANPAALQRAPREPVGNSFTTTAATAVQLSKETGNAGDFGCLSVVVSNPLTTDAGVAQNDNILVGWANPGLANTSGNLKFPVNLQPGQEKEIEVALLSLLWIKPASNTPVAKYYVKRGGPS